MAELRKMACRGCGSAIDEADAGLDTVAVTYLCPPCRQASQVTQDSTKQMGEVAPANRPRLPSDVKGLCERIETLVKQLSADSRSQRRIEALNELARLWPPELLDISLKSLTTDSHPGVRSAAVNALATIADARVGAALQAARMDPLVAPTVETALAIRTSTPGIDIAQATTRFDRLRIQLGLFDMACSIARMGTIAHDSLGIQSTTNSVDRAFLEDQRREKRGAGGVSCPRCWGQLRRVASATWEAGKFDEFATGAMYGGAGGVFFSTINPPYCDRCGWIRFGELSSTDLKAWILLSAINLVVGALVVAGIVVALLQGLPVLFELIKATK